MPLFAKTNYTKLLGDHKSRWKRLGTSRVGAEVASIAVANASVQLLQTFAPDKYDSIINTLAKRVVLPNIDMFDKVEQKVPTLVRDSLHGKKLVDMNGEERAELYAHDMIDFGVMVGTGLIAQGVSQTFLDKKLGLPSLGTLKQTEAIIADKSVQMLGVVALNANRPGHMQAGLRSVLKKTLCPFGIKPETADRMARHAVSMQIANFMGMAGSIGFLNKSYKKELAEQISEGVMQNPR